MSYFVYVIRDEYAAALGGCCWFDDVPFFFSLALLVGLQEQGNLRRQHVRLWHEVVGLAVLRLHALDV